jgi:hypothetical protein
VTGAPAHAIIGVIVKRKRENETFTLDKNTYVHHGLRDLQLTAFGMLENDERREYPEAAGRLDE